MSEYALRIKELLNGGETTVEQLKSLYRHLLYTDPVRAEILKESLLELGIVVL